MAQSVWLTGAKVVTPHRIIRGALRISRGHVARIGSTQSKRAQTIDLRGAYLAPGFIDLHVWGDPVGVSRDAARAGATGFLTTLGPGSSGAWIRSIADRAAQRDWPGATCLGLHLEGPFVNPARGGALPRRSMRPPTVQELARLQRAARGRIRIITLAPELAGSAEAIRWCRRHRIATSLGHSEATGGETLRAVAAGATAVTHVFNAMPPGHHRRSGLLDVALTDDRLTTMVILDGVHVSSRAFRLLVRAKGPQHIALVTDSIARQGWSVVKRDGAFYLKNGTLAGSALTMINAVRNAVRFSGCTIAEAVRMATEVPARLLGMSRTHGTLTVGARADLVAFDAQFRVLLTMVGGRIVYQRGT